MNTLSVDPLLQLTTLSGKAGAAKLPDVGSFFGRIQLNAAQTAELVLQTAQGSIKLALTDLPDLPLGLPLLVNLQRQSAEHTSLQIKVLAALPQEIKLTAAQVLLLQDPKQMALLQQQLQRNEPPAVLAGDALKLPAALINLLAGQAAASPSRFLLQWPTQQGAAAERTSQAVLQVLPIQSEQQVTVQNKALGADHPWQNTQAASAAGASSARIEGITDQGWRQLLPLLVQQPSRLADMPALPAAVLAILQQLRQAQPDGQRVLTPGQVEQQLQAVLQFQPLQISPNLQTGAGSLAVAIQLLLGHLLRQPAAAPRSPAAQLSQHISQLEPQQASQLLRALGSHSSLLQLAQLQNAELPQLNQQWFIPLAIQQQQESRIIELLLERRENAQSNSTKKQPYWQLSMKFDLAEAGQMLAIAKLGGKQLQLQFYTEQPNALKQAEKFLPLLTERLTVQGVQVEQASCQLGKIPDTLGKRRTSLIATQA